VDRRTVRHTQNTGTGVLESEVLIFELGTVNRLSTGTVVVGEVTLRSKAKRREKAPVRTNIKMERVPELQKHHG